MTYFLQVTEERNFTNEEDTQYQQAMVVKKRTLVKSFIIQIQYPRNIPLLVYSFDTVS